MCPESPDLHVLTESQLDKAFHLFLPFLLTNIDSLCAQSSENVNTNH